VTTLSDLAASLLPFWFDRKRARLLVHRAYLAHNGSDSFFLDVTNHSRTREIEVTHVWFDTKPQIAVLNPERPLPVRLKPEQSWQTWIAANQIPASLQAAMYDLGRARLSTGRILKSRPNQDVPEAGSVPGSR
jgi:hypothetical protein